MESINTISSLPRQRAPTSACGTSGDKPRHIPLQVDYQPSGNDVGDGRDFNAAKIPIIKTTKGGKLKALFSLKSSKSKDRVLDTPPNPPYKVKVMMPSVKELGSEIPINQDCVRRDDQRAVLVDPSHFDSCGNRVAPPTSTWSDDKTRRAVIVDLGHEPTFSEITKVCKNTGKIEKIEICKINNYARVWFLEEAGAARLMENTKYKITYSTADSNYQRDRTKYINVKYNWPIENLHPTVLDRIARDRITRCIVIRGLTRGDMSTILGIRDNFGNDHKLLLWHFASKIIPQAYREVEAVRTEYINHSWEAIVIYTDIIIAITAYDYMMSLPKLKDCTIQFGIDPCEPPYIPVD